MIEESKVLGFILSCWTSDSANGTSLYWRRDLEIFIDDVYMSPALCKASCALNINRVSQPHSGLKDIYRYLETTSGWSRLFSDVGNLLVFRSTYIER